MTAPLPVSALVRDAYATVSAHLPELIRLGRGPFVAAAVLGALFSGMQAFDATPVATLATAFAYAWFSFFVFRLVLLGPAKAELARPAAGEGGAGARGSIVGTYMGRAVGIAVIAVAGVFAVALLVVYPITVLPLPLADKVAMLEEPGFATVGNLILAAGLAAWPVGVPVARLMPVLAATAIGRETGMAAAWRLSRGHGVRLATVFVLIVAPYLLGYAALHAALRLLSDALGGGGAGPVANLLALLLLTAMAMTVTALVTVATARAWSAMTGIPATVPPTFAAPPRGRTWGS